MNSIICYIIASLTILLQDGVGVQSFQLKSPTSRILHESRRSNQVDDRYYYNKIVSPIHQLRKNNNCPRCLSKTTHLSLSMNPSILPPIEIPLIQKNDVWGNIAAICATASISHYLGETNVIGRLLGPPVTAMAIAFTLGSIGVLYPGTYTYFQYKIESCKIHEHV